MKKALLLSAGWLLAAGALYFGILLLECYWNLVDWTPRWDWAAASLLAWNAATLAAMGRMARATPHPLSRGMSLLLSLFLLGLGAYVSRAEPLSNGLLGREASSPWWYRGARLSVLALPVVFWAFGQRCSYSVFSKATRQRAPNHSGHRESP